MHLLICGPRGNWVYPHDGNKRCWGRPHTPGRPKRQRQRRNVCSIARNTNGRRGTEPGSISPCLLLSRSLSARICIGRPCNQPRKGVCNFLVTLVVASLVGRGQTFSLTPPPNAQCAHTHTPARRREREVPHFSPLPAPATAPAAGGDAFWSPPLLATCSCWR